MRKSNFLNLSDEDLDRKIYRIISIERLLEIYKESKNSLAKPSEWDDPFENLILKSKVKQLSGEIIDYGFHENFFGQCWSLHKASDAMWRIYSKDERSIRVRTTIRKLAESLSNSGFKLPDATCYIGKVRYMSSKELDEFSNSVYEDGSVSVDNLFHSLLVKRNAFKHEREVRLLYGDVRSHPSTKYIKYDFDPHDVIDQLMLDPRMTYKEFKDIKSQIKSYTSAKCPIKRSLLYSVPEEIVLNVNDA